MLAQLLQREPLLAPVDDRQVVLDPVDHLLIAGLLGGLLAGTLAPCRRILTTLLLQPPRTRSVGVFLLLGRPGALLLLLARLTLLGIGLLLGTLARFG